MRHPRTFAPAVLLPLVALSAVGAVVGLQLLTSLGVTPNTALIGALAGMILGRVPLLGLSQYRSIHAQNLAQSAMSAATFGAANSLLLPIAVPFVLGRADLVRPVLLGVALAMFLDAYLLYRLFGSRVFPADGAWPHGVAAAEAIRAGDGGGRHSRLLVGSLAGGMAGAWAGLPMSAFGIACIGNPWALAMFGIGLLVSGYSQTLTGVSLQAQYVPHGIMVGAGLVAIFQVVRLLRERSPAGAVEAAALDGGMGRVLALGAAGYLGIAILVALAGGLASALSPWQLVAFVAYAAASAYVHELIVGLAAMHAGWFPAFAVALISLVGGLVLGFPPAALGLLTGLSVATGPAFADMGYDLRAGYLLRGQGADAPFEQDGRRQQFLAASVAFGTALVVVAMSWPGYFERGLVPPVARVYAATINAGVAPGVAASLLLWAVPGALLQLAGGSGRQLGVLLATGLLVANPIAGWGVMAGTVVRYLWVTGGRRRESLEIVAAGFIAGDAIWSFGDAVVRERTGGGRK